MKLIVNQAYKHLYSWLQNIPVCFDSEGEIVYDARNRIKVLTLCDGTRINVKRYHVPIFANRLAYKFLRKPKTIRAYENAMLLLSLGVDTPVPIAYILDYKNGLLTYSYLITAQSRLRRRFYEFGEGVLAGREYIIIAFAHFTAMLHDKGIYHKDYSPGNILFDEQDGKIVFSLIDINRMDFGKVGFLKGCANFERLWGTLPMMRLLAQEYAVTRGFDVEKTTNRIIQRWHKFWQNRHPGFDIYTD